MTHATTEKLTTLPQIGERYTFTPKSWAILLAECQRPNQRWRTCFLNSLDTEPPFMREAKAKFVETDYMVINWLNGNETHVLFEPERWAVRTIVTRTKRRELIERRGNELRVTRRYENY